MKKTVEKLFYAQFQLSVAIFVQLNIKMIFFSSCACACALDHPKFMHFKSIISRLFYLVLILFFLHSFPLKVHYANSHQHSADYTSQVRHLDGEGST